LAFLRAAIFHLLNPYCGDKLAPCLPSVFMILLGGVWFGQQIYPKKGFLDFVDIFARSVMKL
jgi:hypothetical protein